MVISVANGFNIIYFYRFLFIFNENYARSLNSAEESKKESCMNELEINIIRRIRNGDINAFEQIMDKYKTKAMSLTFRILKQTEDAEDALQEAFIKTFRAIMEDKFEQRSKFSTYFYRIVYNTAIDHYKKYQAKNYQLLNIVNDNYNDENTDSGDLNNFELKIDSVKYDIKDIFHIDKTVTENEIQKIISTYLNKLPEKYSVILNLFFINDLSHEEISEMLNLPIGTVKNRIFRAKEKLKEILLSNYKLEDILQYT